MQGPQPTPDRDTGLTEPPITVVDELPADVILVGAPVAPGEMLPGETVPQAIVRLRRAVSIRL